MQESNKYLENSPHVREFGFQNPETFGDPESWTLKFGIQLKESGILLTIGIRNPSSADRES